MQIVLPGSTIGIVGGGQLGRMTALAAHNMGYRTHIFSPEADSPAVQVSHEATIAAYNDERALQRFAESVDVISFEFENIPERTVHFLNQFKVVRPTAKALHVAQHRIREKSMLREINVPSTEWFRVSNALELRGAIKECNGKAILKTVEFGYDGKGQWRFEGKEDIDKIWKEAEIQEGIVEAFVPFEKEVSVMIARDIQGQSICYPVTENIHKSGILDTSTVPANISADTEQQARDIAKRIADHLMFVGVMGVEFFVLDDGNVLVNEIAPRPHNSGHWTQDGSETSQFEQFVRAICGLSLGSVRMHSAVRMENIIGQDISSCSDIVKISNAKLHLYGKKSARKGRKMGHVNYIFPLDE